MALCELGIQHKTIDPTLVAVTRQSVADRKQMSAILAQVRAAIPSDLIAGHGFCIFRWVTSVCDGLDAEIGFPVLRPFDSRKVTLRTVPRMQVLSLIHRGPIERLYETQRLLFGTAANLGIASDEFMREVYLDDTALGQATEVQFVIHDWPALLTQHASRVLGETSGAELTAGADVLTLEGGAGPRFDWAKRVVGRLERLGDQDKSFDILSSCAHVYPVEQVAKLRKVYLRSMEGLSDPLAAVDAVRAFMSTDPGWSDRPRREGRVIISSKQPRDPAGYATSSTRAERAKAYCFCPLIRHRLDQGMPVTFCYCGAGWFRQQWEGAFGKPVRIDILESLLQGDERCTFAIHIPDGA